MSAHELRHVAVIAGTDPRSAADPGDAIVACCAKAAQIARASFAAVPGLRAFSWVAPGIDRLLASADGPAARAGAEGERLLAETAASLGAALRLCGRADAPARDPSSAPPPADGRWLLWFRRYSGRDEIVRAATRFFAANPGRSLADAEFDAWLDTAGVPDPDLLLYAGGALEMQDALLWQASYAEIRHTAVEWPLFSEADLTSALEDYHARHRRFGR